MADTLSALRSLMARQSPPLDALVIPSEDYHQSEYVSARDKRRQFVSGFTGSAGLALVTKDGARIWTDGRYFLQATQELSDQWTLMRIGEDPAVEIWIADNLPEEAAIGVDPWCVSIDTAQKWERVFAKKQQQLVQISKNLVDEVWEDRPLAEVSPVIVQTTEFAGRSVADKLKDLRGKLTQEKACGIIITTLDEVAWLYNVRGSDVSYCPVVHAFAIVTLGAAFFYVEKKKLSPEVNSYMKENGIEVRDYDAVGSDVSLLTSNQLFGSESGTTVDGSEGKTDKECDLLWMDPGSGCYALYSKLNSEQVLLRQSPLALAKALKNPVEMDGLKNCHIRDGAAIVQFFVWLDKQVVQTALIPLIGYSSTWDYGRTDNYTQMLAIKVEEPTD